SVGLGISFGFTSVVFLCRAGGGGGGGGGGGAATKEMVIGGGGTDSTVMKEATISPPNTTACATKAVGTVSQRLVPRVCLVEKPIVSNNVSPHPGRRIRLSRPSKRQGQARHRPSALLGHRLFALLQGQPQHLVCLLSVFLEVLHVAGELCELGFLAEQEAHVGRRLEVILAAHPGPL